MKAGTSILLLQILLLQIQVGLNSAVNLEEVILQVNREHKTDINIFINLQSNERNRSDMHNQFNEMLYKIRETPNLITTKTEDVKKVQASFSENSLTVAWLNWDNMNVSFAALDTLLKGRHFTNIILVYQSSSNQSNELMLIFQLCWKHGLTSVMLWTDQQLFTYHPYPSIEVKSVHNISQFNNKSHLENFHQYVWIQPTVQYPPRFYSYTDRRGQNVYAGYLYHMIYLFLTHHNASIEYFFYDMWSSEVSTKMGIYECFKIQCAFGPLLLDVDDIFLPSKSPFLSKVVLLVPSAHEISEDLYLGLPFETLVWLIVLFMAFLFFILNSVLHFQKTSDCDWSHAFLEAFKIIMFIPVSQIKGRSIRDFMLTLLFLFTGIFLTNYYSTSLWSMYTTKVYEPELQYLSDIERTNLDLFVYLLDMKQYNLLESSVPAIIRQRLYAGNETELDVYRKNLNMTYIYSGAEDLADYLLLQQQYLKQRIAMKLPEPFYYRPFFMVMIPRSPLFEQVNRFISRIFETGIYNKFVIDSYWEGIVSKDLRLLRDSEENYKALTLSFFQYAFITLLIGWIAAILVFVLEIMVATKLRYPELRY